MASPSPRNSIATARNPYIHGLRGVLAFSLFVFHVANAGLPNFTGAVASALDFVMISLQHGVELFFGISGIVICFAYQKSTSIVDFVVNRLTRILPVLWVTVGIILLLSPLDTRHALPYTSLIDTIANLFALPPIFPFSLIHPAAWTLSYEFVFYAMFVAFFGVCSVFGRNAAIVFVAAIASAVLATRLRGFCFVVGVGIALCAQNGRDRRWVIGFSGVFLLASAAAWHGAFLILGAESEIAVWDLLTDTRVCALFILGVVCAMLGLTGVLHGRGPFAKWLNSPVIQWLGTISYSFYLWQTLTMAAIKAAMLKLGLTASLGAWSTLFFFTIALPPTLLIAHCSQRLLEARLTEWLRGSWERLQSRQVLQSASVRSGVPLDGG